MNLKNTLSALALLTTLSTVNGQGKPSDTTARQAMNGWYAELAGSSLIGITFNYERYLSRKPGGFSVHAGAGGIFLYIAGESGGFLALPVGLSYNIPTSRAHHSFIEVGGGYTYLAGGGTGQGFYYPVLSWRYLAQPKGLQLRASLYPVIMLGDGEAFGPWIGFSIGKKF